MRILIFNKDDNKLSLLSRVMKEMSFNPITVSSEEDLIKELDSKENDIALIDSESIESKQNEFVEKAIKKKGNTYFLSLVNKEDVYFKTEALIEGFDDYILNTFKIEELCAKIKAIVRTLTRKISKEKSEILSIYDLKLNTLNRRVQRAGQEIELTNKEFLLLEYLLRNKNRIITKTMISEKIWNNDFSIENNVVHVYINFLRSKIDKGFDQKIIKTVRGRGYMAKEI